MVVRRHVGLCFIAILLVGCGQSTQVPPGPEGSKDFECSDELDNDQDGLIDCEDLGCASSPSCQEPDDESDTSDPTDSADTSDPSDLSDASDASTSSDPSDPSESSDASDLTDPSDSSDETDSSDPASSSDPTDSADPTESSDVSDATDASDASDPTDAADASNASDPSDAGLCDVQGFGDGEASVDNSLPTFLGSYKVRQSPLEPGRVDVLAIQIYPQAPYNGPTLPGTYTLDGSNYADCGLCVLLYEGCDANLSNCVKTFFASEGEVLLDALPPQSSDFEATLTNVVLEEVTIDPMTYTSTPVADGSLWCMDAEVIRVSGEDVSLGEFEVCSGSNQCGPGLECVTNPLDTTRSACLTPCLDDSACGFSGACVGFTESSAYCMSQSAARDQECFTNFQVCSDTTTTCSLTEVRGEDAFRCKLECDATNATTCTNGEACVPNGYIRAIELIDAAGLADDQTNWVGCSDGTGCAADFECLELTVGPFCVKQAGWCGQSVGFCDDVSSVDTVLNCYDSQSATCSVDAGSSYCGAILSSNASEAAAVNLCVDLGISDEGVCLGLCDGRLIGDGTGPDLNCGIGAACVPTSEPFFGIAQQDSSGSAVACGEGGTCDVGYQCLLDPSGVTACFVVEKFCQPTGSTP